MRLRGVITSSTVMASRSIRLASIVLCLPRKYWAPSSTSDRSSSWVSVVAAVGRWLDAQQFQQSLHEQIDEPHDRLQRRAAAAKARTRRAARCRSACVAPITFGRDLREHEDQERHRDGADRQREFALAEQADRDDRCQRRRAGVDEVVAEQDHAQQTIGFARAAPWRAWRRGGHAARDASGDSDWPPSSPFRRSRRIRRKSSSTPSATPSVPSEKSSKGGRGPSVAERILRGARRRCQIAPIIARARFPSTNLLPR